MILQKGQRWRLKSGGAIIEVQDVTYGKCIVLIQGTGPYHVGFITNYSIALRDGIKNFNAKLEDDYVEYLEGQDAPQ